MENVNDKDRARCKMTVERLPWLDEPKRRLGLRTSEETKKCDMQRDC